MPSAPAPTPALSGELPLTAEPPGVVLDTNIVLDWLLFDDPSVAAVAAGVTQQRLRWRATGPMRDELAHVLGRGLAAARDHDAGALLQRWDTHARLDPVPPAHPSLRCTDTDDQKFIDLAFAAGARWLISRDRALLALARKAAALGLAIVPAAGWDQTRTMPRM
jgi:uncharacterized protein